MAKSQRIVILGAGFAGLRVALSLERLFRSGKIEIILIDKNDRHLFTPWLYAIASAKLFDETQATLKELEESCSISLKKIISGKKNIRFRQATVTGCDLETRHVILEGHETVAFDALVIALGSQTAFFNIKGLKSFSHELKSLEDATKLRGQLQELISLVKSNKKDRIKIVIGGAGPTGVETAAQLADHLKNVLDKNQWRVILIDASSGVLNNSSTAIQARALKRLKSLAVEVMFNASVSQVDRHRIYFAHDIESLTYDLLIWSGGIEPNQTLKKFALPKDARFRIKVLPTLQVEGHLNIYALGDAGALLNPLTQKPLPALAQLARKEAEVVAKNIYHHWHNEPAENLKFEKNWVNMFPLGNRFALGNFFGVPLEGKLIYQLEQKVDCQYLSKIIGPTEAKKMCHLARKLYN